MQKLNTRSQKIKLVKKLKKQKTSQQLSSSYLIMLSPFFLFFFQGRSAIKQVGIFFQQVKGPKALFLHHSRYCDSQVLITKLG